MALTHTIPPQAYTRDTLVKAIEWIGTQPVAIREKATSADLIVSFYMQACRKAAAHLEAPVSQESFKADLKHLAEGLRQFEEQVAPPTTPQPMREAPRPQSKVEPLFNPNAFDWPTASASVSTPQPAAAPPPPKAQGLSWTIDARSLAAAREIQGRLNLGAEGEAIRLLITLGAERARELFP